MPKLFSHEGDILTYEVLRRWERDGHEVALMRLDNKQAPGDPVSALMCECDFDTEDKVADNGTVYRSYKNDPHKCQAKQAVREAVMRRARRKGFRRWQDMGLEEAILDIHRRVKADEYLGQCQGECIYTEEVAQLLGRRHGEILDACDKLYAEQRLALNGAILTDYVQRFSFPDEMAGVMRLLIEEPLGWPNGDAGSIRVAKLEADVQEQLGLKSGKEAFGKHWPHLDPLVLAKYVLEPTAQSLKKLAGMLAAGEIGTLLIDDPLEAMLSEDALWKPYAEALSKLEATEPEIAQDAFLLFIAAILQLTTERMEIERQMRTEKIPQAQALLEMADWFEKAALHYRKRAQRG